MIRWKVVNKGRFSFSAGGKYQLKYEKDNVVSAVPETLGIFLFETQDYARLYSMHMSENHFEILKAETLEEENKFDGIIAYPHQIEEFYDGGECMKTNVPTGTIFCNSIKVLE